MRSTVERNHLSEFRCSKIYGRMVVVNPDSSPAVIIAGGVISSCIIVDFSNFYAFNLYGVGVIGIECPDFYLSEGVTEW